MEDAQTIHRLITSHPLTYKQIEVIQLSAQGYAEKEIAHMLQITVKSVNSRKKQALIKLGAKNTPHAVYLMGRRGLLK